MLKNLENLQNLSEPRVDSQNRYSYRSERTMFTGFGGLRIDTSNGFFHMMHGFATREHVFGKMVEM